MKKISSYSKCSLLLVLALLSGIFSGLAQDAQKKVAVYAVAFYNLENLFDTINDPEKNDEQFLPDGSYRWTSMKYNNKLENLSYAISKLATDKYCPQGPAVIGISEIENRQVVEDLISTGKLAERNYGIAHYDSPDRRGVDVGLIYDKDQFELESSSSIRLHIPDRPDFITRDQLVVTGRIAGAVSYTHLRAHET